MGATVSVINEEMSRPLDAGDISEDVPVQAEDVKRLRELLHIVYKEDEDDEMDESALTPTLAFEIDKLMTKCANEPGLGRLANDELLRSLLRQQIEELSPNEVETVEEVNNNKNKNNLGIKVIKDINLDEDLSPKTIKQKKDIASMARLHAHKARLVLKANETGLTNVGANDMTPKASSNSMFNNFPDSLNGNNLNNNSINENSAITPKGSYTHMHKSSITPNKLPSVVEKAYSFSEDTLMDSMSSSSLRMALNKSGSFAEEARVTFEKGEGEVKEEDLSELKDLPMAATPSQQSIQANSVNNQDTNQGSQPKQPAALPGRRRPSLLAFDSKDDNTAGPALSAPQPAVSPAMSGGRRRPTPMALDPQSDTTSSAPMEENPKQHTQGGGLALSITGSTPDGNHTKHASGGNGGQSHHHLHGGKPNASGSSANYQLSEDSDVCQLSKSGTLVVEDFRISVDGIVDSPTGRFGNSSPGFDKDGIDTSLSSVSSTTSSTILEGGSIDGQQIVEGVGENVRRPSKMKRRPSLNKSTHAGATGEPFLELQRLGAGASGTVVKAVHVATLRLVAIKTLPIFDAAKRHQMIRELKLLYRWQMESITLPGSSAAIQSLSLTEDGQHPINAHDEDEDDEPVVVSHCYEIVSFHDAFISPATGSVSLVVEYMNGGSLQDLADQGGCPDEAFLASVANHTLRGLKFLHTSKPPKIHRDIKPANILINTHGECKVADFGIYREMDATGSANAHTFIGSLSFMSPERIRGDEYGCPADVWSIGLTLMTVALGRCPVTDNGRGYWALLHELTDKPPPTLPDDLPFSASIRDFMSKALTAEPKERWSTVQLLNHPFMIEHGYGEDSDIYIPLSSHPSSGGNSGNSIDENGQYNISDLQLNELNQVIDKLSQRTSDILASNVYNIANPEPLPMITDEKLARFSVQIDLPKSFVKEAFEKKFNGSDMPKLLI
mmetsp:Transcript_17129/g.22222  ORF Transcript_17129/g.22222 Transcript_17129/m.22222 type:complete len:954 (-) Transcript_17129:243-3104(-)